MNSCSWGHWGMLCVAQTAKGKPEGGQRDGDVVFCNVLCAGAVLQSGVVAGLSSASILTQGWKCQQGELGTPHCGTKQHLNEFQ